ncbi:MAG TPA: response regulator transcription factor [Acidothermaceae bacterium]|nr:response regulator transcription factor [Acidothermaceae bacterium]
MTSPLDVANLPLQRLVGIRVALVEDHVLLAESLRLTLRAEGADVHVIRLAADIPTEEARAAIVSGCLRHKPQIVLLDLDLGPDVGDSDAVIAPIANAGVRVVMLTGSTDHARLGDCLERGATGVISKAEPLDFLVEQVRRAAHGERVLTAQERLDLVLESRRERAEREHRLAPFASLTDREREVLGELMTGRQVEEISHDLFVSEATVRTHVRAILQKLAVRSQLAAVARAREVGWEP